MPSSGWNHDMYWAENLRIELKLEPMILIVLENYELRIFKKKPYSDHRSEY